MKPAKRIRRFVDGLTDEPADGDPLAEGLLDSLAIEQLIAFLEDDFDIVFEDEELVAEHFMSIHTVVELVETKRRTRR
ncbi:MAG: hypothetical protein QOD92_396 [Acidimicrobiaceae bacterium]|jgi:acyl carrier protein